MKANQQRIYKDVEFLTSLIPARNYRNLGSLEKTVDYLAIEFEKLGMSPRFQRWTAEGTEYDNVIASYNAQKKQRLVVGAHYDVCDDQPGADDNASAVAGLLEVARMLIEQKPALDYRIDFVAYCL